MLVFVSYRRDDVPTHSSRLYSALTAAYPANQIFFDASDLQAGSIWSAETIRASRDCVIMACVIGPHWEARKLIRYELRSAPH